LLSTSNGGRVCNGSIRTLTPREYTKKGGRMSRRKPSEGSPAMITERNHA
jgi:hypothetical protein